MIPVYIPLYATFLIVPFFFMMMPVRRALVMSYCLLWIFLPVAKIHLPGLPALDKPSVIGVGVFIAMVLFYSDLILKRFRPRWYDLPMVVFAILTPFLSAVINGMGMKAGLYEVVQMMFLWVVPYFAGRILLGDEMGVQELATGIFFSALIYLPFVWYELLFSPQLHRMFYGYHQHQFKQTIRGWSYRPMVFLNHGLMSSMWLVAGAVCGVWLLRARRLRWKLPIKAEYAVGFLLFTTAASNSMGALLLLCFGLFLLFLIKRVEPAWVLLPLILIPPIYIVARSTGAVQSDALVSLVQPVSEARANSLLHRLDAEDAYVLKAMEQPIVGWGGEGRHRPKNLETGKTYTSDGLWIIVFGKTGVIGLVSMVLTLLVVPMLMVMRQGRYVWRHPRFAPACVLAVLLCLYAIDNLLNAMVSPVYILASGALATYATQPLARRFRSRPRVQHVPPENATREEQPVGLMI